MVYTLKKHLTKNNVLLITAAILFIAVFSRSIIAMARHGFTWHFLVLLFFAYLVFDRWRELRCDFSRGALATGVSMLIPSFLLLFAGEVSSTLIFSEFALVPGIAGCVLVIGGFHSFRRLFVPLAYLIFASSALDTIFDSLLPLFRLVSANISAFMAGSIGFPVILSATYMRLPNMVLNVANECSGINHFIAFIAIALPLGFLLRLRLHNILYLLLLTLPIALFSNGLRVLLLIVWNYHRAEFTHGPNNILVTGSGFFIGLVLLFLTAGFFARFSKLSPSLTSSKTIDHQPSPRNRDNPFGRNIGILTLSLLAGFLFTNFWSVRNDDFKLRPSQLDNKIGMWKGTPCDTIPGLEKLPVADDEFRIKFTDHQGAAVYLYIGQYIRQEVNRETAGCLYDIALQSCQMESFAFASSGLTEFRVCRPADSLLSIRYLVRYASNNAMTARQELVKLNAVLDALLHRSTRGSVLILAVPEVSGEMRGIDTFIDNLLKMLPDVVLERNPESGKGVFR